MTNHLNSADPRRSYMNGWECLRALARGLVRSSLVLFGLLWMACGLGALVFPEAAHSEDTRPRLSQVAWDLVLLCYGLALLVPPRRLAATRRRRLMVGLFALVLIIMVGVAARSLRHLAMGTFLIGPLAVAFALGLWDHFKAAPDR